MKSPNQIITELLQKLQELEVAVPRPTRLYVQAPEVSAFALACNRENYIHYSKRAYLTPENTRDDRGFNEWFVLVELRMKWSDARGAYEPAVVVSLNRGCGSGWSTMQEMVTVLSQPDAADIMRGKKVAATFTVEGFGPLEIYFY